APGTLPSCPTRRSSDLAQAVAHLEAARRAAPDDPAIVQALAAVRGGGGAPATGAAAATEEVAAAPAAAAPLEEARVFAGLEGARSEEHTSELQSRGHLV